VLVSATVVDDTLVAWLAGPFEICESPPLPSSEQPNCRREQPNISLMITLRIEIPPRTDRHSNRKRFLPGSGPVALLCRAPAIQPRDA